MDFNKILGQTQGNQTILGIAHLKGKCKSKHKKSKPNLSKTGCLQYHTMQEAVPRIVFQISHANLELNEVDRT
jgi:hypothetical protein